MSLKAKREAEKKHDAAVRARWAAGAVNSRGMDSKVNRMEDAEGAAIAAAAQEKKEALAAQKAEEAALLNSVNAARWAGLAANYQGRNAGEVNLSDIACTHGGSSQQDNLVKDRFSDVYDPLVGAAMGVNAANNVNKLQFNIVGNGYVSVSSNTPPATRAMYKATVIEQGYEFNGTRYLPSTVSQITAKGLITNSINGDAWFVAGATSLISNSISYGWGATSLEDFSNKTVEKQDFWASTSADTVIGVATGLLAALAVGGAMVALGIATAPLWAVVGVTALVGVGIGMIFNAAGANEGLKGVFNTGIDAVQSWFQ
jgi:hypothetical protein